MAIINLPAEIGLVDLEWTCPPTYQFNRSDLTGASRSIQLGPAQRWTATGRMVPVQGGNLRIVRAFLAKMMVPTNFLRLTMVETGQVTVGGRPGVVLVDGSSNTGYSLALKSMAPGVTNLFAGDIITVILTSEDWQPIVLAADLVADGAGKGIATLSTPLRRTPLNNANVELNNPPAIVRMRDPLHWKASPGGVYEPGSFVAEEAF